MFETKWPVFWLVSVESLTPSEHHGECPSDINKQSLIVPEEWSLDKNIHSVLNNALGNRLIFKRYACLWILCFIVLGKKVYMLFINKICLYQTLFY